MREEEGEYAMSEKPTALRLADNLDYLVEIGDYAGTATDAAAELRRLHEENQKLHQQLGEAVWNYGEKVRANQELLEALKLALGALEYIHKGANNQGPHTGISWRCVSNKAEPSITAIRAAIAKGEQA